MDRFISEIRRRGSITPEQRAKGKKRGFAGKPTVQQLNLQHDALPRTHGTCTIADLGCGDAQLARSLTDSGASGQLRLKVLSFDLHSCSPLVTKADISHLPLDNGSVNVAICCLALMGINWTSFIEEAYRVLHFKGELWIAEIKSRFGRTKQSRGGGKPVAHSVGGRRKQPALEKNRIIKAQEAQQAEDQMALASAIDGVVAAQPDTDVSAFVQALRHRGFVLKPPESTAIDLDNKMFVRMTFWKALDPSKPSSSTKDGLAIESLGGDDDEGDESSILKPCLYKQR